MLSFHRHRRRRRSQKPGRSASGFSLIEVTAVVFVLAIITVPLASAWKMSLTVTAETGEILYANSNRDISSARWVADVASVDAAGVSYTEARACRRSSTSGTLLVTFNTSQVDANGNTQVRRTSYWLTGTGRDRSITRYECKGALGSLSLTNGRETDVAARIGRQGVEGAAVEPGPGHGGDDRLGQTSAGAVRGRSVGGQDHGRVALHVAERLQGVRRATTRSGRRQPGGNEHERDDHHRGEPRERWRWNRHASVHGMAPRGARSNTIVTWVASASE